jgi:hypothetical protein
MIIPVTLLFFPFGVKPIIDMGGGSDRRQFQLLLTSFPVRHHFLKESMEIRTVIVELKMAKLMGDDVLDALFRGSNQYGC